MLEKLRSEYPNATIGAITNGKGNPLMMKDTLCDLFDFCVSGEDDDVFPHRKPHEGIYNVALQRYKDLLHLEGDDNICLTKDDDRICWIHIGDDLANDVGASAKCGALAIWVDLSSKEYDQTASARFKENILNKNDVNNNEKQPFWSTASSDEVEKRKKLNKKAFKFVSAKIEKLSSLPDAIRGLLD